MIVCVFLLVSQSVRLSQSFSISLLLSLSLSLSLRLLSVCLSVCLYINRSGFFSLYFLSSLSLCLSLTHTISTLLSFPTSSSNIPVPPLCRRVLGALGVFIERSGGGRVSGPVQEWDHQGHQDQQEGRLGRDLHPQWQRGHPGTMQVSHLTIVFQFSLIHKVGIFV